MNAIIPLNVAAVRVSPTDSSNVVRQFKGRVALFENIPYTEESKRTSTGDSIVQRLESPDSPKAPLMTGIHLHWELPDYFRKGAQPIGSNNIVFPQAPNRWLVIRYLNLYNTETKKWEPTSTFSWVVESDFITPEQPVEPGTGSTVVRRPLVPVPLTVEKDGEDQPFAFMGRMMNATEWPNKKAGDKYLPDFKSMTGDPYYLNSIGFLGPGFASYYPDCCSVFGFMDRFHDVPVIANALKNVQPIQFRAAYQVIGWIENGKDPFDGMDAEVRKQYDEYLAKCQSQGTEITKTPVDFFNNIVKPFKWNFTKDAIVCELDKDKKIVKLEVPGKSICSGLLQEIVWNMLESPGSSSFLGDPSRPTSPGIWTDDEINLSMGNTAIEALSALLKYDNGDTGSDPELLKNYEYLLDALQLGILKDLESQGGKIINLEEALHSNGFAREQGGLLWMVQQRKNDSRGPVNPDAEITLPLNLAEKLSLLNQAQKNYDTARSALSTMRKQLFMDWFRYIKMYAGGETSPGVKDVNKLARFLTKNGESALSTIKDKGAETGTLRYQVAKDDSGAVTGVDKPESSITSLAYKVYLQLDEFRKELAKFPQLETMAAPAPSFWLPTDPVAMIEGKRIQPVRRNGIYTDVAVRVSGELFGRLMFKYKGSEFGIDGASLPGLPVINDKIPLLNDFRLLVAETALLMPSLASVVADAVKAKGGNNNPATDNYTAFVDELKLMQGGVSQLDKGEPLTGLYKTIREEKYKPVINPVQEQTAPLALNLTFTNASLKGWAPEAISWSTQTQYPEFYKNRYDPFLPVSLIWDLKLEGLKRDKDDNNYTDNNLTDYFKLDKDAVEYEYRLNKMPFTTGAPVKYSSSVVMSKKATFSLVSQIDSYMANYPSDPADPILQKIADDYKKRRIMAQSMSGLSITQQLRSYIPQIPVQDLTKGRMDTVTNAISAAALGNKADGNWYDAAFNSQYPLIAGPFGPLRSGFMDVTALEVVDVFGQRLQLHTREEGPGGSLKVIDAITMSPLKDDKENAGRVYLAPRVLSPARLWYRWLSATHNKEVPGIDKDFVEMNAHPATSPVCGWVMPNHLDNNLFFYNANGSAIGSFGVEHDDLKYRTRPGNILNPSESLENDIGPQGSPLPGINIHVANFMWYIKRRSGEGTGNGAFLRDMMQAILNSDEFINPANFAQDPSLAVLVGRPLAITRSVVSMETAGNLLPLSQADKKATDPWPSDVNANRYKYSERMETSAASLQKVKFPLRLGDLANIDDGLVGYIIEKAGSDPYAGATFYAPAAKVQEDKGVKPPEPDTLQLTLNAAPITLTFLMDPRAVVHATTGVLPVEELGVPADQYAEVLANLQATFFTMPVLQKKNGLVVALPSQSGYVWSWVNPGEGADIALQPNASNSNANWGYSPQTVIEGWLRLTPDPDPPPKS